MQIVFDFIAGDLPFEDFWAAYQANPEIGLWLDQLTDFHDDPPEKIRRDLMLCGLYRTVQYNHDGHVLRMLQESTYPPKQPYSNLALSRYEIYCLVEVAVLTVYPNVKRTRRYQRDGDYYFKALGRSIGGSEVMDYATKVLEQFPVTMKVADRLKAGKEALWAAFHIKDRKFPRWAQEADWPMGKNSPMEYLGQHRDGELVALRFRDVDTGEIRVVEQFY